LATTGIRTVRFAPAGLAAGDVAPTLQALLVR
jgi:hypothetical protein